MIDIDALITNNLNIWSSTVKKKKAVGRGTSKKIELYGLKKLRELILDLAVRGLLVAQNPDNEMSEDLLEKIDVAKAHLIANKKIKKQKPLPGITSEEIPFSLPNMWTWIRLGEATNYGSSDKISPEDATMETWVLELEDVEKKSSKLLAKVRFNERNFKSSKNVFSSGDVIYGKLRPYLDKVIVADEDGVCTTEMIPVRAHACITSKFLRIAMKSPYFISYANESTHGMNLPRMGTIKARMALIPLLSKEEQKRIVAKVDELMALCDQLEQQQEDSIGAHQTLVKTLLDTLVDSASHSQTTEGKTKFEQAWERIADHFDTLFTTEDSIDQLKQTILQLAVMGKLVPQDPNDESAGKLIARMDIVKKQLIKDKKIRKQRDLPPLSETAKPYDLPSSWDWARLSDIGDLARGKSKHRPRNDPALYQNGNIPLVQTGDVARANGTIETYSALYNKKGLAQSKLWPKGTMCITIAANIADTGTLGFDACFPDSVVGFTPFDDEVNSKYFELFIRTAKNHLEDFAPSTAQKNINLEILSQLLVPCPPVSEISRIVSKVQELLEVCDQIKLNITLSQLTQLKLSDSIAQQALN